MRIHPLFLCIVYILFLGFAPPAYGYLRDQGQIYGTDGDTELSIDEWSQSITAGIPGQLSKIQVAFQNIPISTRRLRLSIFIGGNPISGSALFTEQIDIPANNANPFTWDLNNANLLFNAGDVFSLVIQADEVGFEIAGNDPPGYTGGELFKNGMPSDELSDIAFITYVTPTHAMLHCSQHPAPFDGNDPLCDGEVFDPGMYVYLWPEHNINSAEFIVECNGFYHEQSERRTPWEPLGGDPIWDIGECNVNVNFYDADDVMIERTANFMIRGVKSPYVLKCSTHPAPFDGFDLFCNDNIFQPGVYVYVWPQNDIDSVEFATHCDGSYHEQYEKRIPWEALGGEPIAHEGDCTVHATMFKSSGSVFDMTASFEIDGGSPPPYALHCSQNPGPFGGTDPICDGGTFNPGVYAYVWPQDGVDKVEQFTTQCNGFFNNQSERAIPYEALGGDAITAIGNCEMSATVFRKDGGMVDIDANFEIDGGGTPSEYAIHCSENPAPFDGNDPLCDGGNFNPGVYVYIWPQDGINSVEFESCGGPQRERFMPWEALGGDPLMHEGYCTVYAAVSRLDGSTGELIARFDTRTGLNRGLIERYSFDGNLASLTDPNGDCVSMMSEETYSEDRFGRSDRALNNEESNIYKIDGCVSGLGPGLGWSISAWVLINTGSNSEQIITGGEYCGDWYDEPANYFGLEDGKLALTYGEGCDDDWGYTQIVELTGTTDLRDSQWHHVVATVDVDNTARLYVDTILEAVKSNFYHDLFPWNAMHPVGNIIGSIDDLRVYDRALSEDDIEVLYLFQD